MESKELQELQESKEESKELQENKEHQCVKCLQLKLEDHYSFRGKYRSKICKVCRSRQYADKYITRCGKKCPKCSFEISKFFKLMRNSPELAQEFLAGSR